MIDLRSVFRVDASPMLGSPVFALDYRAFPQQPRWWRRWWAAILRASFALWRWGTAIGLG